MKKVILSLVLALSVMTLSAQVMGTNGVKNTLWTGFGNPNSDNQDTNWYGMTDTLQARVDVAQFTMEAMINWGLFTPGAGGARTLSYTNWTAFYAANMFSEGNSSSIDNAVTDKYYVNFLWHPVKGLDLGAGTRLEWKVGPAPACSDYYWGPRAHVKQGGLKYDRGRRTVGGLPPLTLGSTDVAGFVYYPNVYTSSLADNESYGSIGIRYKFENIFEGGIAIPSGTNLDDFSFNVGLKLSPMDLFSVSFAYEGVCKNTGHLYAGLQFFLQKNFTLNAYYAMNNLGGTKNDGINGLGLSAVYNLKSSPITITPEVGFTFYEDPNFSNAFYVGSGLDFALNKQFDLGTWLSFAWGAKDKRWANNALTKEWNGGTVFALRPYATMTVNKSNKLTLYADYQSRTKYDNNNYSSWAAGFYWTYTK